MYNISDGRQKNHIGGCGGFGFVLIDKPPKMSSHDVVERLRRITGIRKIGHAGTLDPFATGLLILGVGREATKQLLKFQKLDKEYIAEIRLGAVSDTFDREGRVEERSIEKIPSEEEIKGVLRGFLGEINQVPPIYSAKSVNGRRLYELAREGIKIMPKPTRVKIYKIEILYYQFPFLKIKIHCSSGTYIRSLANDIGEKLGCGAYLENLQRTRIGNFSVDNSSKLFQINKKNWKKFLQNLSP